jgi:hypothetical protein
MNTKSACKFTFDTEFRPEGDLVSNAARKRQRKVFTQEEIDQMCAKARCEGLKAGQVRAAEAVAAAVADSADAVRAALAGSHAEIETLREEAAQIALAAARKLAPVAIATFPSGDVEAALRRPSARRFRKTWRILPTKKVSRAASSPSRTLALPVPTAASSGAAAARSAASPRSKRRSAS